MLFRLWGLSGVAPFVEANNLYDLIDISAGPLHVVVSLLCEGLCTFPSSYRWP